MLPPAPPAPPAVELEASAPSFPNSTQYESPSGGIIAILKKLLDEFRDRLGTGQEGEMNAQGAYDMVI